LTGFSIGPFFLLIALAMIVLGPFRRRSLIFWPPMAGVFGFVVGSLVVAPFSCVATTIGLGDARSTTVCSSLIGITYTGAGIQNPSLLPGICAGLLLAAITALTVAAVLWLRREQSGRDRGG
jgi:hypothetical protein